MLACLHGRPGTAAGEEVVVSEHGFSDKHRFALPTR